MLDGYCFDHGQTETITSYDFMKFARNVLNNLSVK
jgi:hypothetical protein